MVIQSKKRSVSILLIGLVLFLIGCASNDTPSETTSIKPQSIETTQNAVTDPFRNAVNKAMEAAELAQTAQTLEEWHEVANTWQQAIDLMESVETLDPNYEVARQKAQEYQANKEYAQSNVSIMNNPEQMYRDMLDAISSNDLEKIDLLLTQGFDPNYQSKERTWFNQPYYVLSHAASFGTDALVQKLLESGARWNSIPNEALSDSLISASCEGQPFIVQELLNAGANPNYSNNLGEKPLSMATSQTCRTLDKNGNPRQPGSSDHSKVVQILQDAGAR
ncbi:MAG: ankyrin repeat domain-containing protein [Oculatellaceae cyanobacterium bins.114]|nr:ankyrin repeat domain-containing protein [Oculatellaceae cyanobacterium bins.114]